jgi:hypothetical protein
MAISRSGIITLVSVTVMVPPVVMLASARGISHSTVSFCVRAGAPAPSVPAWRAIRTVWVIQSFWSTIRSTLVETAGVGTATVTTASLWYQAPCTIARPVATLTGVATPVTTNSFNWLVSTPALTLCPDRERQT